MRNRQRDTSTWKKFPFEKKIYKIFTSVSRLISAINVLLRNKEHANRLRISKKKRKNWNKITENSPTQTTCWKFEKQSCNIDTKSVFFFLISEKFKTWIPVKTPKDTKKNFHPNYFIQGVREKNAQKKTDSADSNELDIHHFLLLDFYWKRSLRKNQKSYHVSFICADLICSWQDFFFRIDLHP